MRAILFFTTICLSLGCFSSEEPKTVHADSQPAIAFPGHQTVSLAHSHDSPARTSILELTIPAKTFGAPPHSHTHEDEYFYVLEGSVEFLEREKTVTAPPGTLMILPRGHIHGFWNASDKPAKLLLIISPGEFDLFFDDVVARIKAEYADAPEKVGALIAEEAAKHGVQIHMDKIPESAKPLLK